MSLSVRDDVLEVLEAHKPPALGSYAGPGACSCWRWTPPADAVRDGYGAVIRAHREHQADELAQVVEQAVVGYCEHVDEEVRRSSGRPALRRTPRAHPVEEVLW